MKYKLALVTIGVVGVIVIAILIGLKLRTSKTSDSQNRRPDTGRSESTKNSSVSSYAKQIGADQDCKGEGPIEFTHPPMKPADVAVVLPYGLLAGGHVTPIDHMYFSPKDFNSKADTYPVYAIADGTIATIAFRADNTVEGQTNRSGKKGDYRLDVYYNCTFFSYYDLITSLSPELAKEVSTDTSKSWNENVKIQVKAGQEIGRIGGQTLDWAVYNSDVTLPGLLVPAHYEREPWKIHTDYKSVDYFAEPIKTDIYKLLARQVEPRAGKIDYDVDGKLVGNWFLEGTNGYAGNGAVMQYWDGHLAIVPDYIDPTAWHFSTGNWNGQATQFGITIDKDPAQIGLEDGLIKYEVFDHEWYNADTNKGWMSNEGPIKNPKMRLKGSAKGTVLLQLVESRKLKVETFVGKTKDQVSGFTSAAKTYER